MIEKSRKINKGGMGFGLTISKKILQQLGGEITVESEYGKGSCFRFKIKLQEMLNQSEFVYEVFSSSRPMHEESKEARVLL